MLQSRRQCCGARCARGAWRARSALSCLTMRRGRLSGHFPHRNGGEGRWRGPRRASRGAVYAPMLGPGLPRCRGRWGVWWLEWSGAGASWRGRGASTGARQAAWGRRGRRGWGLVEVACGPGGRRQRAAVSGALARPAWRGEEVDGVCREAVLVRGATHLRVGFGSRGGQRSRRAAGVVWGTSTCGAGATTR